MANIGCGAWWAIIFCLQAMLLRVTATSGMLNVGASNKERKLGMPRWVYVYPYSSRSFRLHSSLALCLGLSSNSWKSSIDSMIFHRIHMTMDFSSYPSISLRCLFEFNLFHNFSMALRSWKEYLSIKDDVINQKFRDEWFNSFRRWCLSFRAVVRCVAVNFDGCVAELTLTVNLG